MVVERLFLGYKGPHSGVPKINGNSYSTCEGDCDCGEGLPCGEYLWDHRNGTMLRDFLINEFVLNPKTGLGNKAVSGFYFDDGWSDKPSPVPAWAPPTCVSMTASWTRAVLLFPGR